MNEATLAKALAWASRIERFDDTSTQVASFRAEEPGSSDCVSEENSVHQKELPLEVCAGICVSLARRPTEASSVLLAHGLDAPAFRRMLHVHLERIRDDVKRGRGTLQRVFDGAYVAKLEEERGAINALEYVTLVRAQRAGNVEAALVEVGLPVGAWMHIQRVWLVRLVRDAGLAAKVRRALDD